MAGKNRSGLANDGRAYRCVRHCVNAQSSNVDPTPTPTTYTVTYDGNGGSGTLNDPNSPYTAGSTVTVLANTFTRTGYTFAGWSTNSGGTGSDYNGGDLFTINSDKTLYAQWIPSPPSETYTLTYNGNGGTGSEPALTAEYTSGTSVTVFDNTGSPPLSKSGYTFAGWNTAADGTGTPCLPGNPFVINANTTLYAQWTPVVPSTYTVTYSGNTNTSGTALTDSSSPYIASSTVTVLGIIGTILPLVNSGYAFDGWNTQPDGSGTASIPGFTFIINGNTILYAVWLAL